MGAEVAVLLGQCKGIESLGEYGADRAVMVTGTGDSAPVETFVAAAGEVIESPAALALIPDNIWGRDLASQLAAQLGGPLVTACERLAVSEDGASLRVVRSCFGGQVSSELTVTHDRRCVFTVREHAFLASPRAERRPCEVVSIPDIAEPRVALLNRHAPDPDSLELGEADVIVSGGRGAGGEEGFRLLAKLARKLGGTVAASRVAVDLGLMPRTKQVGQTGSRVAPQLYLACGISGAREHMVGIREAAALVAINTDERAPIMSEADLAVVADAGEVVTKLLSELEGKGTAS